jgi:hypothetical protein
MKLSDEPEVTKSLNAAHGFWAAEGRLELYEPPGIWREARLARYTELGGVTAP